MKKWLSYNKYSVLGLGRSGIAVANILSLYDKTVIASDTRSLVDLRDVIKQLPASVAVYGGKNYISDAEVVVASPGLSPLLPVFSDAQQRGIPVISEVELAFNIADAPFVAITGTDGKTTTTQLTGELFIAGGRQTVIAGNIGTPLCSVVENISSEGIVVAEISASQLWTCIDFKPHVAAFTSLAEDHLDYFESYDDYIGAKRRLIMNADTRDWGVFNYEDDTLRGWAKSFCGRRIGYGYNRDNMVDCELALWSDGKSIYVRIGSDDDCCLLENVSSVSLKGRHNIMNMMCAAGIALSQGIEPKTIRQTFLNFKPLAHRLEPCHTVQGRYFINDSKATNSHSALAGLRSITNEFCAIVGGVDKGLDIDEWIQYLTQHAASVVVIGAISDRVISALTRAGYDSKKISQATSMPEAVRKAWEQTTPGMTVVLSPACSSYDMFNSYVHRGDVFKKAVKELAMEYDKI